MINFPSIEPVRVFLASGNLQDKYKMPNRTEEMQGGGGGGEEEKLNKEKHC